MVGGKWGSDIDTSRATFAPLWRNSTDRDASSFASLSCRHIVTIRRLVSFIKVNSRLWSHLITHVSLWLVRFSCEWEVLDLELLNASGFGVMKIVSIDDYFTFQPWLFVVTSWRVVPILVPVGIAAQSVLILGRNLICWVLRRYLCSANESLHRKNIVTLC